MASRCVRRRQRHAQSPGFGSEHPAHCLDPCSLIAVLAQQKTTALMWGDGPRGATHVPPVTHPCEGGAEARSRHGRSAHLDGRRGNAGDALGMDNGAPTVDAYPLARPVRVASKARAETPGSIPPLLVRRRASTCPRLSRPLDGSRCSAPQRGVLLPFHVGMYA